MQNGPLCPHGGLEIREMFNNMGADSLCSASSGRSQQKLEGRERKRERGVGKEGENGGRKQSKTYTLYTVWDEAGSKLWGFFSTHQDWEFTKSLLCARPTHRHELVSYFQ